MLKEFYSIQYNSFNKLYYVYVISKDDSYENEEKHHFHSRENAFAFIRTLNNPILMPDFLKDKYGINRR